MDEKTWDIHSQEEAVEFPLIYTSANTSTRIATSESSNPSGGDAAHHNNDNRVSRHRIPRHNMRRTSKTSSATTANKWDIIPEGEYCGTAWMGRPPVMKRGKIIILH
jgi:hypothetical protein